MSEKINTVPDGNNDYTYSNSINPQILYEDDAVLIANKQAGILSMKDSTGRQSLSSLVEEYLKKTFDDKNIYHAPIHRLDRPVSGTMLFAKTTEAAGILSSDMKNGRIDKYYFAIVKTIPENSGDNSWETLDQYYVRKRDRAYIVEQGTPRAATVSLKYMMLKRQGEYSPVLIKLITGKRHQIRVQMSSQGMPIAGDRFYGSDENFEDGIICLHALSLGFNHPVSQKRIIITAPLPFHIAEKIGNLDLHEIGLYDEKTMEYSI